MKNKLSISLVLALVLVLAISVAAMAQGRGFGTPGQNGTGTCVNFVDEDGDGVCDNAPLDGTGLQMQYGHRYAHSGQQIGFGSGPHGVHDGTCDNFVDEDGDGVNDNAPRDGTGEQYGRGPNR